MADSASGAESLSARSDETVTEGASRITSVGAFSTLLSNGEWRTALECLCESDEPCSIEQLTDDVASRTYDVPADRVSMIVRTSIATNLHYDHLPTLSAYGLLEYDSQQGRVTDVTIDGALEAELNGDG